MRVLRAAPLPLALLVVVAVSGCATTHRAASGPSPTASRPVVISPSPMPSNGPAAYIVPPGAAAAWHDDADASLRIDITPSGSIVVTAGCLGFRGGLTESGESTGSTFPVVIFSAEPAGTARCTAVTRDESEFVAVLRGTTSMTVTSTGLELSGAAGRVGLSR